MFQDDMLNRDKYYRPSGRFGLMGLLVIAAVSGVAAVILGPIYGLASRYMPLVYITVIALLAISFGLGMAVIWGGRLGKVRSAPVAGLVGLLAGAVALYLNWVVWICFFIEPHQLIFDPQILWTLMVVIGEEGAWSTGGGEPNAMEKGVVLYAIWAIEALFIVACPAVMGWWRTAKPTRPFCERCEGWCTSETIAPLSAPADPTMLRTELERGETHTLKLLRRTSKEDPVCTSIDLLACPQCDDCRLLTIKVRTLTMSKKGKAKDTSTTTILENLYVSPEVYEIARNL